MIADVHGKPIPGASAHLIANSWTSAIMHRRSLILNRHQWAKGLAPFPSIPVNGFALSQASTCSSSKCRIFLAESGMTVPGPGAITMQ